MAKPAKPQLEDPLKDSAFFKVLDRINNAGKNIGMIMILVAIVTITIHVVMRKLFHHPINWTIDVSMLFLFYITIFGSAWLLREDGHVSLDILKERISKHGMAKFEMVTNSIGALLCLVVVYFSILQTIKTIRFEIIVDMPLQPPKWIVLGFLPIAFMLMFFEFVRKIVIYYHEFKKHRPVKPVSS